MALGAGPASLPQIVRSSQWCDWMSPEPLPSFILCLVPLKHSMADQVSWNIFREMLLYVCVCVCVFVCVQWGSGGWKSTHNIALYRMLGVLRIVCSILNEQI